MVRKIPQKPIVTVEGAESGIQAALAVNRELIRLYRDIGGQIVEQQKLEGWGTAVIERLADDLQQAFPGVIPNPLS